MEKPIFLNDENIPLVTHDEEDRDNNYNDYNTPNTSRVHETTYATPETTKQMKKVKRDKLAEFYEHLNVTVNLCLTDLKRFRISTDNEKGDTILEFYKCDKKAWVSLTKKQAGKFPVAAILRDRFSGLRTMKKCLDNDKIPLE